MEGGAGEGRKGRRRTGREKRKKTVFLTLSSYSLFFPPLHSSPRKTAPSQFWFLMDFLSLTQLFLRGSAPLSSLRRPPRDVRSPGRVEACRGAVAQPGGGAGAAAGRPRVPTSCKHSDLSVTFLTSRDSFTPTYWLQFRYWSGSITRECKAFSPRGSALPQRVERRKR